VTPDPRVTIGLPVYNGERFLRQAVDSVLGQTYGDLELVISDNASSDGTEQICRDYVAKDARVRYLRSETNLGAAWNFNRLLDAARGVFFKWVPADDACEPTYLARCVEALDRHPDAVLAYPRSIVIDAEGKRLYDYSPEWEILSDLPAERLRQVILKGGHWINADSLAGVIRTQALRRTRLFPRYQGGDKRPLGELSLQGKFVEVPEYLLLRRFHEGASSRNNPHSAKYDRRSVEWMTEFFKGSTMSTLLPSWCLLLDHLRTVWASRLPVPRKLELTTSVARAASWHRAYLLAELKSLGTLLRPR
jgi:glycosyltransferase involved in cell wall biosynthesis